MQKIVIDVDKNGDKNRNLWLNKYLNKIKPYLRNVIIELQNSDTWKIQLNIAINFISSKYVEEERVMHSRSNNIKFISHNDGNKVVDQLFESLSLRYQWNLETSTRGDDFIFASVQLMHCKCHIVTFNHFGQYIGSPGWIKKEKATIDPKNMDDRCFYYMIIVALNYE